MLNLPQKFKNGFAGKAINVYPIVVINAGGNIIRLAQIKGLFDGEYYEDRNLDVSSVNEDINIAEKTFQINQVGITVSNYIIEQIRFSEKFKGFSFTNAEVDIYYANEGCETLDDCLKIFKGFVKNYSGNQEQVSFDIEDHSQYTLDIKTFPRNKTYDPASETIDASKNIHFPVVYGHVDKSPMIFTRNNPLSLVSKIYPDAIFENANEEQQINIQGFANDDEPLLMFRDDMYLTVPREFLDLPANFLINGYDYSNYNGTDQYEISDSDDYIILEKQLSDFIYTQGMPKNIQGRDQFQIEARREVTGVSASSSETDVLYYGDIAEIEYLGEFNGYKVLGNNQEFMFPDPQGDLTLSGYYKDFMYYGPRYGYRRDQSGSFIDKYYLVGFSLWDLTQLMYIGDTADGKRCWDMCYLPNASEVLPFLNLPAEYNQAEWVTIETPTLDTIASNLAWNQVENLTENYFGTSFTNDQWEHNTESFTEHSINSSNNPIGDINYHDDLQGIRIFSSSGNVPEIVLGLDDDASEYFIPNVTAWIDEVDDGFVCLRKVLWGTRIDEAHEQETGIPEGSFVFGLFPALGKMIFKNRISQIIFSENVGIGQGENERGFTVRQWEMTTDCLYSYKNPYLENPENPTGYDDIYQSLIKFDYGQIETFKLHPIKHMASGWNEGELLRVTDTFDLPLVGDVYYDVNLIITTGLDATSGGAWCPIVNNNNFRQQVKLDLTFNSLSGNDIVLGSVWSRIKGRVTMDFYRQTSPDDNNAQDYPHLFIECDAFKEGSNDNILKKSDILSSTAGYNEGIPPDDAIYRWSTGHSGTEFEGSQYEYLSDSGINFPDVDNPDVFYSECNAYADDDQDQWRQNLNSVNNVTLNYWIGHPSANINTLTTGFFNTRINNFQIHQRFIVGNTPQQKYFADVIGRIDDFEGRYTGEADSVITQPSDILMHIMEKEFGYFNVDAFDQSSVEEARINHDGWRFDFAVSEETKAKDFISDFAKDTKLIPRFRHDGTFGFINIYENYGAADEVIVSSDVSDFSYSKTPISDVKLMVKVDYNYDIGLDQYVDSTNFNNDGAVPVNYNTLQQLYNINSLEDAYLKVESRYIRDESTAKKLRNYLLEWNKNQHNVIECSLPPNYMHLECGDVVEFDSLIEGMTIFGEDYTQTYYVGGESAFDGGQTVLPYFIIESINKSQSKVQLTLTQLHEMNPVNIQNNSFDYESGSFYIPPNLEEEEEEEEVPVEEIVLGDVNFDGSVNVLDIVSIVNMVIGSSGFNSNQFLAADVNQDTYVDVLDIITIIQAVINEGDLGTIEVGEV